MQTRRPRTITGLALLSILTGLLLGAGAAAAGEINVYSARKEALIKPLLDQYSAAIF